MVFVISGQPARSSPGGSNGGDSYAAASQGEKETANKGMRSYEETGKATPVMPSVRL